MKKHKSSEITFTYYLPEHADDVSIHVQANAMYCVLFEIKQMCDAILKRPENGSDGLHVIAQEMSNIIAEEVNLSMVK